MFNSLQGFIAALDAEGELLRISEPTSPILQITRYADREAKMPAASPSRWAERFDPDHAGLGGRALLFDSVVGCDFPVLINAFGSYRRMELALGCDESGGFEAIGGRIAELLKPQPPSSVGDLLTAARRFLPLLRVPPRRVRRGKCQDVVRLAARGEVNLLRLPIIKCWPLDGDPSKVGYDVTPEQAGTAKGEGRYITFAGMHTIHADDEGVDKPASHNIGMYRAQLIDETHLAMHWHVHHDGASHWRSWKRKGKPMPIAICLGGEAVLPYAATAPLPPGITELLMAGFLHGKGIEMVRAKTVPLWVPANSEIVIEGWVSTECGEIGFDPRKERLSETDINLGPGAVFEGPFGDHTGFYSLPDRYPVVTVTAITHRANAVYPTTIVGLPPQEDYYLGKATERVFFPLLKTIIHDIEDYHLPMFGCFHNCAFIKINKQYPLQARRVMHAVWGAGQMAWTKMIIVVDDDVNVHDEQAVLAALMRNCDFARDVELVNGPLDILDHAAPRLGAGHKIGFDATRPIDGEEVTLSAIPEDREPGASGGGGWVRMGSAPFAPEECLFIAIDKTQGGQGSCAIHAAMDAHPRARFVIAVDKEVDVSDWEQVFFYMCANADPGRDTVRRGSRLGFDATAKMPGDERRGQGVRDFPPVLTL